MTASLEAIQDAWLAALQDPQQQSVDKVTSHLTAGVRNGAQGFAVYVNNIRATLIAALSQSFPVTVVLMTRPLFCRAVLHGLQHYPPRQGDLGRYGADFPASVAAILGNEDATQAALVAEVARCEWIIDQLLRHPVDRALTAAELQSIPSQHWPRLRLRLAAQATLFVSREPVYATLERTRSLLEPETLNYELSSAKGTGVDADYATFLKHFLIVATKGEAEILPLSAADHLWLSSVKTERSLKEATDTVLQQWPEFDLLPLLVRLLYAKALVLTQPVTE